MFYNIIVLCLIFFLIIEKSSSFSLPKSPIHSYALKASSPSSLPSNSHEIRKTFENLCVHFQDKICKGLEEADGKGKFTNEEWLRSPPESNSLTSAPPMEAGWGRTRVLADGNIFEKAGVNLSVVRGRMPKDTLDAALDRGVDRSKVLNNNDKNEDGSVPFYACGVSSVLHPKNPHCPTMHFNFRYFETGNGLWWFGGGADITPSYLDRYDIKHFHSTYKNTCDKFDTRYYPYFKKWADKYFLNTHRGETRGLGGIFFDDLNDIFEQEYEKLPGKYIENNLKQNYYDKKSLEIEKINPIEEEKNKKNLLIGNPKKFLPFIEASFDSILPSYVPIILKNKDKPFTEKEKEWQQIRRGRYVEFNLVHDRGTIFGLKSKGRTEAILMSMPLTAKWLYNHVPEENSKEEEILNLFKNPIDWV